MLGDLSHVDGTHVVGKQLEDKEEKISDMEASDSSTGTMGDPSAAEGSSTSAGHMPGSFGLAPVVFLVLSFMGI